MDASQESVVPVYSGTHAHLACYPTRANHTDETKDTISYPHFKNVTEYLTVTSRIHLLLRRLDLITSQVSPVATFQARFDRLNPFDAIYIQPTC